MRSQKTKGSTVTRDERGREKKLSTVSSCRVGKVLFYRKAPRINRQPRVKGHVGSVQGFDARCVPF